MRAMLVGLAIVLIVMSPSPVSAQSHGSNWLHRNMMDTTIAYCWNDSLTVICFPPGSMGMMMPDSMYCRIDFMPMDSLHHPHDSTMIGWCRVMMGTDSMHFNLMQCDSMNVNHQMEFMRGLRCRLHWDSLRCDSMYRGQRPVGIKGWDGSNWVSISGSTINGNTAQVVTTTLYSAFVFVGEPAGPLSVHEGVNVAKGFVLRQNYPNPFNPTTNISFSIPFSGFTTLKIYNAIGGEIATLVSGRLDAGTYQSEWDARNLASGVYFYQLRSGGFVQTSKLTLLR